MLDCEWQEGKQEGDNHEKDWDWKEKGSEAEPGMTLMMFTLVVHNSQQGLLLLHYPHPYPQIWNGKQSLTEEIYKI